MSAAMHKQLSDDQFIGIAAQLMKNGEPLTAEMRERYSQIMGPIGRGVPKPEIGKANGRPVVPNENHGSAELAVSILRGDAVTIRPIRWVWPGWIARGKLHIVAGPPGVGKTTLVLALLATITMGGRFPDGSRADPCDVLIWSGEDDIADTLAPRLACMGADMSRVHFITGAVIDGRTVAFDPAKHMDDLLFRAAQIKNLGAVMIDPITSAVAGDSHKNSEVRRGLAPLRELAERLDVATLGVSHFSKGTQGKDPLERVTGSLAFGAAARVVLAAIKRPDEGDCVLVRAKSNIGPDGGGFRYRLEQSEVPGNASVISNAVVWLGSIDGQARDILGDAEGDDGGRLTEAKEFLGGLLSDGPMSADQVLREARGAGHSERTIRRAREAMNIQPIKELGKGGKWKWHLPNN